MAMKQKTISRLIITDAENGGVTTTVEFEGTYDPEETTPSQAFLLEMLERMQSPQEGPYGPGTIAWSKRDVEKMTQRKF